MSGIGWVQCAACHVKLHYALPARAERRSRLLKRMEMAAMKQGWRIGEGVYYCPKCCRCDECTGTKDGDA